MSVGGFDIGGFVSDFAGDFADFATDFAADFTSDFGLDSFTDSFGGEFLTDIGGSFVDFGGDIFSGAGEFFGDIGGSLYEQVGSFAGNADWFNATSFGSILDSAGAGFTEFFGDIGGSFSGITNYLPTSISSNLLTTATSAIVPVGTALVGSAIGVNPALVSTALSGQLPSVGSIVGGATGVNPNLIPGFGGGGISIGSILSGPGAGSTVGYGTPGILPTQGINYTGLLNNGLALVTGSGSAQAQGTINTGSNLVTGFENVPNIDITGVGLNPDDINNLAISVNPSNFPGYDDDGNLLPGYELDSDDNPYFAGFGAIRTNAADVNLANFPAYDDEGNLLPGYELDEDNNPLFIGSGASNLGGLVNTSAGITRGLLDQARQQQTIRDQRQNKAQAGDWRVRLRLAPRSNYLYNDPQCGPVLWPLRQTDGVIFPYTPTIDTAYKADYEAYNLTHSNYRGYFYKGSYVDAINVRATFTAQDTSEANYLLATIHFFRSATKMFYGQDAQRGSPPPLVYLSGLGEFQFNEHPCVISQFNYNLPGDVDYIRAHSAGINGTNLQVSRNRQTIAGNPLSYALQRLASVGLSKGALDNRLASNTLGIDEPTYVPTKMEISLTLFPIQSREQVSKQFSVKNFANGNLLKGGFW